MSTYFRILSYSKPYGNYLPFYIFSSLISVVFSLVNLILLMPLLDIIFEQKTVEEIAKFQTIPEFSLSADYFTHMFNHYMYEAVDRFGKFGSLLFVCSIIAVSVLISNVFRYIAAVILSGVRVKIIKNLRLNIFSNLSRMHIGYFSDQRKGDMGGHGQDAFKERHELAGIEAAIVERRTVGGPAACVLRLDVEAVRGTGDDVHGLASAFVVVGRMVGMLVGILLGRK